MSGYLYLATNPVMPGLTKIGFTESVLADRFASLQSTGVPVPFELYAAFQVDDARSCEKAVHKALAQERLSENREFFRVAAKDALARILPLLLAHSKIDQPEEQHLPQSPYSDLDELEREILAAYAMAPTFQRPNDWEWLRRMFYMDELDGRHCFHTLKTKGYLREIKSGSRIFYDLAPRGVEYGLVAREDPNYLEMYGDKDVFSRGLGPQRY